MKLRHILINMLPLIIWQGYFYSCLKNIQTVPPRYTIQVYLLLLLPIIYGIYNFITSKTYKMIIIKNAIFAISQAVGYYISGMLYYNFISSDSETAMIANSLPIVSIFYIALITCVFCGIKKIMSKLKKNDK